MGYRKPVCALAGIMTLKVQMEWEGMVLRVDKEMGILMVAEEALLEDIFNKLRECYLVDLMAAEEAEARAPRAEPLRLARGAQLSGTPALARMQKQHSA